jgi:hypothetical protein
VDVGRNCPVTAFPGWVPAPSADARPSQVRDEPRAIRSDSAKGRGARPIESIPAIFKKPFEGIVVYKGKRPVLKTHRPYKHWPYRLTKKANHGTVELLGVWWLYECNGVRKGVLIVKPPKPPGRTPSAGASLDLVGAPKEPVGTNQHPVEPLRWPS